jgi:hypothetical protein
MKTKFLFLALFAIIISSGYTVLPMKDAKKGTEQINKPTDANFSFFRTHRQGKNGITATWGLTVETGVSAYCVEMTDQDPTDPYANWDIIMIVPPANTRSYKVTNNNVYPGFISCRVRAIMNDGSEMVSDFSTIHIVSH